ncbi:MAG: Gfo/Idh/MocA family oxidoreductase, partial [Candidatus Competibacteraceae bacterium]
THSNEPMHQAALMCRQRGRIVLIGVTGLELSRDDFFKKELTFQVSASYGPGRYDPNYEEKGQDYPVGFVRWTEQRNFEAVLDLLADGRLNVQPLISHRFKLDQSEAAYAVVGGSEPSMGILLDYPRRDEQPDAVLRQATVRLHTDPMPLSPASGGKPPAIALIGSGNYATGMLIPAFKQAGVILAKVASNAGVSGVHAGRKYGFAETTTDTAQLVSDPKVEALVIATRHNSHARLVLQALEAGKPVFVEKPLCLTLAELEEIAATAARLEQQGRAPLLMVGFNRRFAPHVQKIKALLTGVSEPKALVMTVSAGAIPADHWTQDPDIGGGRIIGEACHFIDLLRFLMGRPIVAHSRIALDSATGDTVSLQLGFADGSIGAIHYFANGSKAFPKERLEVFAAGRVLQLDNFRKLTGYGWPGFRKMNLWRQDKGQKACAAAFVKAVQQGGPAPIPIEEILEVSRVTLDMANVIKAAP